MTLPRHGPQARQPLRDHAAPPKATCYMAQCMMENGRRNMDDGTMATDGGSSVMKHGTQWCHDILF